MTKIKNIRPTQITCGFSEVKAKESELLAHIKDHGSAVKFLENHPVPVVAGWKGELYATDHHHLLRACVNIGISHVFTKQIADISHIETEVAFWEHMEKMHYAHPLDHHGERRGFVMIPHYVEGLKDDPYRSLAGFARRAGAFERTGTPYQEFEFADLFRRNIAAEEIKENFDGALEKAIFLCKSEKASHLPGFIK